MDAQNMQIAAELASLKMGMTEDERNAVNERAKEVLAISKAEKPVDCLPSMKRSDLALAKKFVYPDLVENDVALFRQPVRGLTFLRFEVEVTRNHDMWDAMTALIKSLRSIGCGTFSDEEFARFTERYTGGINVSSVNVTNVHHMNSWSYKVRISTYCIDCYFEETMRALEALVFEPHLDNVEGIRTEMIRALRVTVQHLPSSYSSAAGKRAKAGLTMPTSFTEYVDGLTSIERFKKMVDGGDFPSIAARMKDAYDTLFRTGEMRAAIHVSSKDHEAVVFPRIKAFVRRFNEGVVIDRNIHPNIMAFHDKMKEEKQVFLETSTQSNFCSLAVLGCAYDDNALSPYLSQLADILGHEYLHTMIRVALGAYGAWGQYVSTDGVLVMSSYRDQNMSGVYDAFWKALEMAADGISDEMVDRMVVRYFSELDKPETPQERGVMSWQFNTSRELVVRRREAFYYVKKEDLMRAARYLRERMWKSACVSSESIAKAPEGFVVVKPFSS
jgi:Zn-dependent M16 (insulinase) family peptidase